MLDHNNIPNYANKLPINYYILVRLVVCACNNVLRLVAASLFTIFISTCTVINFKLIVSKINKKKKKKFMLKTIRLALKIK